MKIKQDNLSSALKMDKYDAMVEINLTVSEGKRLIAKALVNMPLVKEKMDHGMIILTRGTTNTYLAEELIGFHQPHGAFLTGHFLPVGTQSLSAHVKKKFNEIILIDGKEVPLSYADALELLKEDDIVFKGGNLMNYAKRQVGVCIGAPDGGTVYRFLPYVGHKKAKLIVPIGLEKDTSFDLDEIASTLEGEYEKKSFLPKIHIYKDCILFTEIEAIQQFADVKVFPNGLGGISGREGGASLVVAGRTDELEKVLTIIKTIQGEKSF